MSLRTNPPLNKKDKTAWRVWAKGVRSSLPTSISEQVCSAIAEWPQYQGAQHILTYSAFGSEIDLAALQKASNKTFYLTRTWASEAELSIHKVEGGLERHPHGYLQPLAHAPKRAPERIDLVLVPGLAFSKQGHRLGYGKGYYDRLLPKMRSALWLGICADALLTPVPHDAHDAKLDYIATESGIAAAEPE